MTGINSKSFDVEQHGAMYGCLAEYGITVQETGCGGATAAMSCIDRIAKMSGAKAKKDLIKSLASDDEAMEKTLKYLATLAFEKRIVYGMTADEYAETGRRSAGYVADEANSSSSRASANLSMLESTQLLAANKELNDFQFIVYVLEVMASGKLSGDKLSAFVSVVRYLCSDQKDELICLVLDRTLRCGVADSGFNSIWPGLIFKMGVMLAKPYDAKRVKSWPVAVERKLDGVRAIIDVTLEAKKQSYPGGEASYVMSDCQIMSRTGKAFPSFQNVLNVAAGSIACALVENDGEFFRVGEGRTHRMIIDAEIFSRDFQETVSGARSHSAECEDAVIHAFDVLPYGDWTSKSCSEENHKRYKRLQKAVKMTKESSTERVAGQVEVIKRYLVRSDTEIQQIFKATIEAGHEGLIVKPVDHKYAFKRSFDWMKLKAEESIDVPIVGAVEGTGKYQGTLGALVVDVDGVKCNVGTGLSDSQRRTLWTQAIGGTLIGRMVEVQYHVKTPDGSLRHPRFKRFRDDKADSQAQ